LRLANLYLRGRIFDDDSTDGTNLNRNSLTLITDVEVKKVVVAAQHWTRNIAIMGFLPIR